MKRKVGIIFMVVLISMLSVTPTFAADKSWNVSGSTAGTKTFHVTITPKLYGKDSITLKRSGVTQGYQYMWNSPLRHGRWWKVEDARAIVCYQITIKEGNKTIQTKTWHGTEQITLKFGKAFKWRPEDHSTKTYTVIVKPIAPKKNTAYCKFIKWTGKANTWRVYSTTSGVKKIY